MTNWHPTLRPADRPIYKALAEAIGRDVAAGRLVPGARLPPQRELAHALGVTVPTITRAYNEAAARGWVSGEVGRGTFVRPPLAREAPGEPVDLAVNALPPHAHLGELAARMQLSEDPARRVALLGYPPRAGLESHRRAGAAWIGRRGLPVPASQVLVTAGAQHALLVALSSVCGPGDTLLVEELTYGGLLEAARLLGLLPRAVAVDAEGMVPDALDRACRETGARVVALQPVLHNPTGVTMTASRRAAIAATAARHRLHVIEDDIYGMLAPETPPLATELASRWTYVTSLSKSVVAGVRVGYVASPPGLTSAGERAIWSTLVAASPITGELATALIEDGTADAIVAWKREEMRARQAMARERLAGLPATIHPASPHVWWPLLRPWRAADFAGAARSRGILLGATDGFLGQPGATPRAVRVCLGPPSTRQRLGEALDRLRDLAGSPPATAPLV